MRTVNTIANNHWTRFDISSNKRSFITASRTW